MCEYRIYEPMRLISHVSVRTSEIYHTGHIYRQDSIKEVGIVCVELFRVRYGLIDEVAFAAYPKRVEHEEGVISDQSISMRRLKSSVQHTSASLEDQGLFRYPERTQSKSNECTPSPTKQLASPGKLADCALYSHSRSQRSQ